jgi:hypothetical protein
MSSPPQRSAISACVALTSIVQVRIQPVTRVTSSSVSVPALRRTRARRRLMPLAMSLWLATAWHSLWDEVHVSC